MFRSIDAPYLYSHFGMGNHVSNPTGHKSLSGSKLNLFKNDSIVTIASKMFIIIVVKMLHILIINGN